MDGRDLVGRSHPWRVLGRLCHDQTNPSKPLDVTMGCYTDLSTGMPTENTLVRLCAAGDQKKRIGCVRAGASTTIAVAPSQ